MPVNDATLSSPQDGVSLEWGNARVRVKNHPRNYRTGLVDVPTYSAKCPGSHARKRLKKLYRNVYAMECGNNTIEVDIDSGNYVEGHVWRVSAVPPRQSKTIGAPAFHRQIETIYGIASLRFKAATHNIPLDWTMYFTDAAMSQGVAIAVDDGESLMIEFTV